MKSKKSKGDGSGSGGRRPARQRTQVQHYSDDNPSTFTKKRRRGDGEYSDESESDSEDNGSNSEQQIQPQHSKKNASSSSFAAQGKSSATAGNATAATTAATATATLEKKKRKRPAADSPTKATKKQEVPPPPPPRDLMMPHTASLAPILPLATTCPHARFSLTQQYPVVFGRGLGVPKPPPFPQWTSMAGYDFYFPEDYRTATVAGPGGTTKNIPVVKSGPWPVCRVVTTIATFQNYTAIGDSAGFVMLYATGAKGLNALVRLDTTASHREHKRQRQVQTKLEQQCKHKPELLKNRSAFWATAKTPNAIIAMTWIGNLLVILTPQEIEALRLNFDRKQNCDILWSLPVASLSGPRKNGANLLLSGGGLLGSYLELHPQKDMLLWSSWGMAVTTRTTTKETQENEASPNDVATDDGWPLLICRNASEGSHTPEFVKLIPFSRHEEQEAPPTPVKRSPGRPPKKKPKPKIPVSEKELVWTENSKCHAVTWDNHSLHGKEERLIMAYSGACVTSMTEAQVYLALAILTDDRSENDVDVLESNKLQFARIKQRVSIPVTCGARSVTNVPEVSIKQSPKGTFTLVSGSRGVRMFRTDNLTCLRIYGEHVSLHGKTMVWQSCFVLDNRLQQEVYQQQQQQSRPQRKETLNEKQDDKLGKTVLRQSRQGTEGSVWIEQDNTLATLMSKESSVRSAGTTRRPNSLQLTRAFSVAEDEDDDDDESYWLHQAWIVGVPHPFRGPKELQDILYFWQGEEKLPLFTLPLPHDSGGVQSIQPVVSSSSRNDGIWLRLMVATVNGECFELVPTLKTDFPGIMYDPGYAVVEDNLEYIEDEEELDKVMMEVPAPEGEDDNAEEEQDIPVAPATGDCVDPELAEAIRLSLLEAQAKQKNAISVEKKSDGGNEDENDSVDVVVTNDSEKVENEEEEIIIPCKPENFLQMRLLPDIEADTIMDEEEGAENSRSPKDAEFASEVLSILPQARFALTRWERQKPKLFLEKLPPKETLEVPEKVQQPSDNGDLLNGPMSGKMVRGKKTKAGNLEALLKSSIDPVVRDYMAERDRCWADGRGSTLQEDAWELTTSIKSLPLVAREFDTKGEKVEKSLIHPSNQNASSEPQNNGMHPVRKASLSHSVVENGKLENSSSPIKPAAISGAGMDRKDASSRQEDEKEVALELLMLSPAQNSKDMRSGGASKIEGESNGVEKTCTTGESSNRKVPASQASTQGNTVNRSEANKTDYDGMQVAIIELKDYTDAAQQYSCTGTVEVPLSLEDCKLSTKEDESGKPHEDIRFKDDKVRRLETGSVLASKPDTCAEEENTENNGKRQINRVESSKILEWQRTGTLRCAACEGRMVIHICGKRALPVDFEALARAEKEKREKEEEEKRKIKIEKRKLAEAKRKEAKRRKKEQEEQERRAKEEELRRIRQADLAAARARVSEAGASLHNDLQKPTMDDSAHGGQTTASFAINPVQPKADPVHFAIANAWQEHASKFSGTPTDATIPRPSEATTGSSSDGLAALASMAEVATQESEKHISQHVGSQSQQLQSRNRRGSSALQENAAFQKRAAHGFFSSADAYPSGITSTNLEARGSFSIDAAAQLARRNQIMSSYHAMSVETSKAKVVDLPGQSTQTRNHLATHSFSIDHGALPQHRYDAAGDTSLRTSSSMEHASRPYFGYTQISNSFKPKIPLGSYAYDTIYTSKQVDHEEASQDQLLEQVKKAGDSISAPATSALAGKLSQNETNHEARGEASASSATSINWLHPSQASSVSLNTTWLPQPVYQPGVINPKRSGTDCQTDAHLATSASSQNDKNKDAAGYKIHKN